MVYDKKKIFSVDKKKLTISFLNGDQPQQSFLRRHWEILEFHLEGQLDFSWIKYGGEITIQFDAKDSDCFVGLDGLQVWEKKSKPSLRIRDTHSYDQRIILHEACHMLGCKHQHQEAEFLRSSRFGVNIPDDVESIMRYRQKGEKRNHHLSLGDIDFLQRYDKFRALGESWRNIMKVERRKIKENEEASATR